MCQRIYSLVLFYYIICTLNYGFMYLVIIDNNIMKIMLYKAKEKGKIIMKKESIVTIITAICTLIAGLMGGYAFQNTQNVTIEINGESLDASEIKNKLDILEEENQNLKITIENLEADHGAGGTTDGSITEPPFNKPTTNSEYLVYNLEPYNKSRYRKITDDSMKIAGVSYNNGFQLYTTYSDSHCIFNFEGKYSTLYGKIGCDDSNYTDKIPVEFLGDDVLMETIVVHKNAMAQDFSLNISGISKFEIKIPYASGSDVDFAEVKIQ